MKTLLSGFFIIIFGNLAFADMTLEQIIAGIQQRETSIKDISYQVRLRQYDEGNPAPVMQVDTKWKAKGNLWQYQTIIRDKDSRILGNITRAYDGTNTRYLDQTKEDHKRGEVIRENKGRNGNGVNDENYYLTYNNKLLSNIIKERNYIVEPSGTSDGKMVYWLKGQYSPNMEMAILVDPGKGFCPLTVKTWVEKFGHNFDRPTIQYQANECQPVNGIWMPISATYQQRKFSDSGEMQFHNEVYFQDVKVNAGLENADFVLQWPLETKIHDYNLNLEYFSNSGERMSDMGRDNIITKAAAPDPVSGNLDLKTRQFFIPHAEIALAKKIPFVYDLKSGENINPGAETGAELFHKNLEKLGKGDISWDGDLLTSRDAVLFSTVQDPNQLLKYTPNKGLGSYKLPSEIQFPFTILARNKEGIFFLIAIQKINDDGIKGESKELLKGEVPPYQNGGDR